MSVARGGYVFTYYRLSGGMVVTRGLTVEDAGIVGNPRGKPITEGRLNQIAYRWLMVRVEFEMLKMKYRPAEQGRKNARG